MRRFFSLIQMVVLCSGVAIAETATVGDCTWTYEQSDDVWKITSVSSSTNEIVVPCALGGKYISVIASNAFEHCYWLNSAKVSVGIINIEEGAFRECKYLKKIELPRGLLGIGHFAFMGCCDLESVVVPDGVQYLGSYSFHGCTAMKSIAIPDSVKEIGNGAFYLDCSLREVRLPSGLEQIRQQLFLDCTSLTNVVVGPEVWVVREDAFKDCSALKKITVPELMEYFGEGSFASCASLKEMDFEGPPPDFVGDPGMAKDIHIRYNVEYAEIWAQAIELYGFTNAEAYYPKKTVEPEESADHIFLTVTNVVVQYVLNSIRPDIAVPTTPDTGFVNIITEVKSGGAVSVPASWANNYPVFTEKFGSDFTKALVMKTGKKDGAGNEMFVWQDYVAGTDPTNPDSKFTASIAIVNCEPVISWSPELKPEQAELRKYTVYGKVNLRDEKWSVIHGDAGKYGFFRVTVEMK